MRLRRTAAFLCHFLPPSREPDVIIGGPEDPYMKRWHLLKTPWLSVFCHTYQRSDDARANHDHPWRNWSFILRGAFMEQRGHFGEEGWHLLSAGDLVRREACDAHRIELFDIRPVEPMTLFITGPKVREWGFWCPKGWRHNREFSQPDDDTKIGKGCE